MPWWTVAPEDREQVAREQASTIELLTGLGIDVPQNFECRGVPQITLVDLTKKEGEPVNPADFKGRISIGQWMDSSGKLPFPAEPVRLTVVRWGKGPEQCGRIVVDTRNNLSSITIVSYVGVTIDKWALFAPSCVIMDCDGRPLDPSKPACAGNLRMAPVRLERYVWLGARAIVLPGVTIGEFSVVGAGAVAATDVPSYSVAAGNPAKVVAKLNAEKP